MKDRQDSIAARIAGTIAGGVRRRQQGRTPRALVFDATGEPRVVAAGTDEQLGLIAAAEELVEIVIGEEAAEPDAATEEADAEPADDAPAPAPDDPGPPA